MRQFTLVALTLTLLASTSACGGRSSGADESRSGGGSVDRDSGADRAREDSNDADRDDGEPSPDASTDDQTAGDEAPSEDQTGGGDDVEVDGDATDDSRADDNELDDSVTRDDVAQGDDDADDNNADDVSVDAATDPGETNTDEDAADEGVVVDDGSDGESAPLDPDAPLWLFAASPMRGIVNVNDPEQTIEDFSTLYEPSSSNYPWSADGRWLADVRDGNLVLEDLQNPGGQTVIENGSFQQVLRWADDEHVLVREATDAGQAITLVALDGESVIVVPGEDNVNVATHSVSPDGRTFAYGTSGSGDFPFWSVDLSSLEEPRLVDLYPMSPPIYPLWSSDSNWMAYGVSGEESMVMLWHRDGEPERATEEGTSFTPLYSFAPDSSMFLSYGNGTDGGGVLAGTALTGNAAGAPTPIGGNEGQSPADWSPNGRYIVYSDGEGAYLRVYDSGEFGSTIEIPDFRYGCELDWVDEDRFIYRACVIEEEVVFYLAEISGDDLETTMLPDATEPLMTVSGKCMINHGPDGIQVGTIGGEFEAVSPLQTPVSALVTAPGTLGFAWVSLENLLLWQPLDGCSPAGAPRSVGRRDEFIQVIDFVPR